MLRCPARRGRDASALFLRGHRLFPGSASPDNQKPRRDERSESFPDSAQYCSTCTHAISTSPQGGIHGCPGIPLRRSARSCCGRRWPHRFGLRRFAPTLGLAPALAHWSPAPLPVSLSLHSGEISWVHPASFPTAASGNTSGASVNLVAAQPRSVELRVNNGRPLPAGE